MEIEQVLHMNSGDGEKSYSKNSGVAKKVILATKSITEEAIVNYYSKSLSKTLSIVDMGCSCGPNTLLVISHLLEAIHNLCLRMGRELPEFQVHFNDLHGNDFNSVFVSLPSFLERMKAELGSEFRRCFFTGIPGSFYGRLFPSQTLDFVHSSYSLHWLSQAPKGIENNKGNICLSNSSPPNVIKAYKEQFEKDFSNFLKCRSEELVNEGKMVLTFYGRKSEDFSRADGGNYTTHRLAMALNSMVLEGLIEEEKLNTFNMPQYSPCPSDVKSAVLKEGSFAIDGLEVTQVNWYKRDENERDHSESSTVEDGAIRLFKELRSVFEPLIVCHFGQEMIEETFRRYERIIVDGASKEENHVFNYITICLTKKMCA